MNMRYKEFGKTGMKVSEMALGTWGIGGAGWDDNPEETRIDAICAAVENGVNFIDTAPAYNAGAAECLVGKALKQSGTRQRVIVATKCGNFYMGNGTYVRDGHYDKIIQQCDDSLKNLQTDYIALMLIHWPVAGKVEETWKIMEEYVDAGKIRAIGVSNFNPHHVDELLAYARIKPAVNQIEIHPYMTQQEVVGNTFAKGIQVEGCAPLGQGGAVLQDGTIGAIARKHGKSIAQVILRWNIQRGLIAIPRCDNADYTAENMDIFDFELSPVEMSVINGLNRNERTYEKNDPDNFPW